MATSPIPTFALYGEDSWQTPTGFAHIETIAARSAMHDWAIAPHRHDCAVQVLLVLEGPAQVTLDGTQLTMTGPAFVVVPTSVVHGFAFAPHTVGHVLTLSQDFVRRALGPGDALGPLLTRGGHGAPNNATLATLIADQLIAMGDAGMVGSALFDALAEAMIRALIVDDATDTAPGDRRLAVFRHMVETHLTEHRPLAFYARSIGTTVRTLSRLTQRHLGHSPQALINRRLAMEAQRLLQHASATAVAAELGFVDPSYFSRFYLRMTGTRPQVARARLNIL